MTASRTCNHATVLCGASRPQVRIAEFNSKPVVCVLTGSGWPGAARDRALAAALGGAAEGLADTLPGAAGRGSGRAGKEPKAGTSPVLSMEELDGTAVRAAGARRDMGWWALGRRLGWNVNGWAGCAVCWLWILIWAHMFTVSRTCAAALCDFESEFVFCCPCLCGSVLHHTLPPAPKTIASHYLQLTPCAVTAAAASCSAPTCQQRRGCAPGRWVDRGARLACWRCVTFVFSPLRILL